MASSRARPYEQTVDVETPELVVLTYSIAGVGSRVLAALTDLLISVSILLGLGVAMVVLSRGRTGSASRGGASGGWALAVFILAAFAVMWGYYGPFRRLLGGQTPATR